MFEIYIKGCAGTCAGDDVCLSGKCKGLVGKAGVCVECESSKECPKDKYCNDAQVGDRLVPNP